MINIDIKMTFFGTYFSGDDHLKKQTKNYNTFRVFQDDRRLTISY